MLAVRLRGELVQLTLSFGFGGSKRTDEPAVLGSYLNPISLITSNNIDHGTWKACRQAHLDKVIPSQGPKLLIRLCMHELVHIFCRFFTQLGKPCELLVDVRIIFILFLRLVLGTELREESPFI